MKNLLKISLFSVLLANILNRDVNIELFKKEDTKTKGISEKKISEKKINNEELKNGFTSDFTEDFFYLKIIDNKPVINNEKMGVQYSIKQLNEEDYNIDINIKTDKLVEALGNTEIYINSKQKTNDIGEFKVKSKKIEAKIIQEKEKIVIEIGNDYYLTIEKLVKPNIDATLLAK